MPYDTIRCVRPADENPRIAINERGLDLAKNTTGEWLIHGAADGAVHPADDHLARLLPRLESAAHARRRGARTYAAVAGGALGSDAFHVIAPAPGGRYAGRTISRALANAGTRLDDVDHVYATVRAPRPTTVPRRWRSAGRSPRAADRVAVSAPSRWSAADGQPEDPGPECDLYYVPNVARRMPVHLAVANAFGFGGQDCVAVFTAVDT